jgi:hypothetical protein
METITPTQMSTSKQTKPPRPKLTPNQTQTSMQTLIPKEAMQTMAAHKTWMPKQTLASKQTTTPMVTITPIQPSKQLKVQKKKMFDKSKFLPYPPFAYKSNLLHHLANSFKGLNSGSNASSILRSSSPHKQFYTPASSLASNYKNVFTFDISKEEAEYREDPVSDKHCPELEDQSTPKVVQPSSRTFLEDTFECKPFKANKLSFKVSPLKINTEGGMLPITSAVQNNKITSNNKALTNPSSSSTSEPDFQNNKTLSNLPTSSTSRPGFQNNKTLSNPSSLSTSRPVFQTDKTLTNTSSSSTSKPGGQNHKTLTNTSSSSTSKPGFQNHKTLTNPSTSSTTRAGFKNNQKISNLSTSSTIRPGFKNNKTISNLPTSSTSRPGFQNHKTLANPSSASNSKPGFQNNKTLSNLPISSNSKPGFQNHKTSSNKTSGKSKLQTTLLFPFKKAFKTNNFNQQFKTKNQKKASKMDRLCKKCNGRAFGYYAKKNIKCKVCFGCKSPKCGNCKNCLKLSLKKACIKQKCLNPILANCKCALFIDLT